MRHHGLPLAFALVTLVGTAWAGMRPPTLPTRDVAASYAVSGVAADALPGGVPGVLRLAWDAVGERLHVDAPGRSQSAIVDLQNRQAVLMDAALRTALTAPLSGRDVQGFALAGARFEPRGKARVAGLACTEYRVRTPHGSGTMCITADGVPLRGAGIWDGRSGRFTATAVRYGVQPGALFEPPPGYFHLSLPEHVVP